MRDIFTLSLMASTIRLATPLVLAALGGLFSERSGVINIALEGMMLAGAFTAAAVTYAAGNPFIGLVAGMAAGLAIGMIHAVVCIRYKADQVVTGTAINILMFGMPAFLSGAFFLSSGSTPQIPKEQLVPWLPIIVAFALVPVIWYVLYRTPFGLRLRSVGENPEAADAAGGRLPPPPPPRGPPTRAPAPTAGPHPSRPPPPFFTRPPPPRAAPPSPPPPP